MRIALLLDGLEVPAWFFRAVELVLAEPEVEIPVIVLNTAPPVPRPPTRIGRYIEARHELLYALLTRIDRMRANVRNDPTVPMDIRTLAPGAEIMHVLPRQTKFSDFFPDEAVEALRAHNLDVAIRLGFRILRGSVLSVPQFGVWSYHHGANEQYRGGPAGFWEVLEGNPVTGAILQVLTESLDGGQVLYKSYAHTERFSFEENRAGYYWTSAPFIARTIRRLRREGTLPEAARGSDSLVPYGRRLYKVPTNGELLRPLQRFMRRRVAAAVEARTVQEGWMLGLRMDPDKNADSTAPDTTLFRFKPVIPPRHLEWADPFPIFHEGKHYLFIEEMTRPTRFGHISVMEVNADGTWTAPVTIIKQPYHLSYPHVFRWNDTWWMTPETCDEGRVELWRATDFPLKWTLDRVLMDGVILCDVTLHQESDRWWMFAGSGALHASPSEELCLFYADSPLGPWTPHPLNPVVSDVRCARPAGHLFRIGNRLYRPAQDCARNYGHAIVIHRVDRLDPEGYEETTVGRLDPEWLPKLSGTHTLNRAGRLTVVDGLMRHRRW